MNKKDYDALNRFKEESPKLKELLEKETACHYKNLSIASHEILNHLSFIGSSYQIISSKYPETKDFKFWDNLGTSINELTELMQRTSLCRYCVFPQKAPVLINDILYQLPDEADNRYPNEERLFSFNVEDKKIEIDADSEHILIAFNELISNSYDATQNNDTITISSRLSEDLMTYTITVSNKGQLPEIHLPMTLGQTSDDVTHSPDDIDILTSAFYTSKKNHNGLGLYIVMIVCMTHNGTLSVSQDSQSTHFHINLPVLRIL